MSDDVKKHPSKRYQKNKKREDKKNRERRASQALEERERIKAMDRE
jgi:hypothetical protein